MCRINNLYKRLVPFNTRKCNLLIIEVNRSVAPSGPHSALSCPFSSCSVSRQNFEVRKRQNFARYKSAGYSRTFQAVGWRHCLPRENHQPAAALRRRLSGVTSPACPIRLIMPCAIGQAAAYCSVPTGSTRSGTTTTINAASTVESNDLFLLIWTFRAVVSQPVNELIVWS